MPRIVYVPELGRAFSFKDGATDQEVSSFFTSNFPSIPGQAPAAEAPKEPESDESGFLDRFLYGAATGISGIPGGIASLFYPAEIAAETPAGRGSIEAEKYLGEFFGIDRSKEPTISQQAGEALGSVASFIIPGTAAAKTASVLGAAPRVAARIAAGTAGLQGVALGAGSRAETVRQQLESGMQISEEDQLAAQRLSGLIGASEALPINRFFGPLSTLLSKVPVSKAPVVEQIVKSRLGRITRAGAAEGAQEAAAGIANDIMEYGVYNPDVQIGQDLLSNAGTGAFAGSFVEGVIQLAAGRKLRPYRQLEQDISREAAENAQALRQGKISQAAEDLRQYNVEGDIEIVEQEIDGLPRFVVRTEAGNSIGEFTDPSEAEEAVNVYKQRTDAKVTIRRPEELPSVFPVKINGKEYRTTDEIIAERDNLVSRSEGLAAYMSRPDVIKREAARQNVSEALVKRAADEEVDDLNKQISKFNDFLATAKPTPAAGLEEGDLRSQFARGAVEETALPEAIAPEAPIGVVETAATAEVPAIAEVEEVAQPVAEAPPVEQAEQPVVVRRTLSQAEAEGPIVRERNQATIDRYQKIYEELQSRLSGKVPNNAKINLQELINTDKNLLIRGQARTEKTPNGIKSIVDLSTGIIRPDMSVDQAVKELLGTLNHEIIHVLRDQGVIRPAEWAMLSKAASKTKMPGKAYTYLDKAERIYTPNGLPITPIYANPDAVVEEAVAEMYKDWVDGKNNKETRQVGGLFNRITEFFRSIFRVLKSSKYQEIFESIDRGEVGAREGVGREETTEARFAAAPALGTEEFRKWFADSKAVNTDGTPKVFYHGTSKDAIFEKFKSGQRGIWFTDDPNSASQYAVENDSMGYKRVSGWDYEPVNTASRVIPVYLSYKNPYTVSESDLAFLNKTENYAKAQRDLFNKVRTKDPTVDAIIFSEGVVVVFDPKQVKSTLNSFEPGAATSPRFSAAPAVDSDEFRNWFGNSKTIKPDGTPKVYYHGTPFSFKTFGKSRSATIDGEEGPFFFSESPKFANQYAETRLYKGARGEDVKSGGRVLPVYISAQNPFDYENDQHIASLKKEVGELPPSVESNIRNGVWRALEAPAIQRAIRRLGFDGVYLNEAGFKNLAIYRPEQVKSIFNQFEAGAADSTRFSAAPLPPYVEQRNRTLFRPQPDVPFYKSMFDFFFGHPTTGKTLNTVYGQVDMSAVSRFFTSARVAGVDSSAYVEYLEKAANQKSTGNFERLNADYSATAALAWFRRSSQLTASVIMMGKPAIKFDRPGDIQSATIAAEEDPDSLMKIFATLLEPGPVDSLTNEQKDKREVFKSYATAMRAIGLRAAGKPVPRELDNTYINTTISFTQANYPEVVEAYKSYQRFNKNLITAARDAGVITSQELASLTQKMDYYGFYREVFEEELVPGGTTRLAGKFDLREYKGSEYGNLIDDPMFVIVQNTQFWMNSIARNIATNKAFKLAKDMGEARLLGTSEKPDPARGESEQVMFYREAGVTRRFAVSDPLLVTALGSDDRTDMGKAMQIMGMPTQFIRESVTRDPAFMITNLIRDTLSSWITSGEDITPFLGTASGFAKALKGSSSFQALMGRGVVGSYDLAMREPAELAAIIRRRLTPNNVHNLVGPEGATRVVAMLWDRLGVWSEASDAATRIAVYEAAKKQGLSEAEATFRAIQIMDFSRRGSSATLAMLTKLIPFLNARIQGLDVLYQASRAGLRVLGGRTLGERDANLGKKFLVRGAMLAAISLALEYMNDGDEAYEELPDYLKKGNLLIPLKGFGLENEFLAIAKPFEAGLLFSTMPQQFYKTFAGEASTRDNINFFVESYASTFGVNPIPQIILPALEVVVNHDFYTGLPLISEGKARLSPELQYDSRTSTLARMLGDVPIVYNLTTGKFEGVSPIIIDQLIGGYGGPFGTLIASGVGMAMEGVDVGPERLPRDFTQMPVIKRFFVDAESRSPKTVSDAYELFRIVDEANRSFSRLRQTGDAEAVADYLDRNKDVLKYKKYVYTLVDRLNKLGAYERQIERDKTMTDDEKREAMNRLREVRKRLTAKVGEINKALGR